jgi:hypothetical protein
MTADNTERVAYLKERFDALGIVTQRFTDDMAGHIRTDMRLVDCTQIAACLTWPEEYLQTITAPPQQKVMDDSREYELCTVYIREDDYGGLTLADALPLLSKATEYIEPVVVWEDTFGESCQETVFCIGGAQLHCAHKYYPTEGFVVELHLLVPKGTHPIAQNIVTSPDFDLFVHFAETDDAADYEVIGVRTFKELT